LPEELIQRIVKYSEENKLSQNIAMEYLLIKGLEYAEKKKRIKELMA
jgi:hypothetical protein